MPTPFMHLHLANDLRGRIPAEVQSHWPAFFLGNIAPDFQAISEVKRQESHFYPIPPEPNDYGAFERMLAEHEIVIDAANEPNQAWFLLGYAIHLEFDLWWDHSILTPVFRNGTWGEPLERYTAHNTLLTWLDHQSRPTLDETDKEQLQSAEAAERLPFDRFSDLPEWRDRVAEQLAPDSPSQTIEIYAKRMRLSPEQFEAQLENRAWMQANVFDYVDADEVQRVILGSRGRAIDLIKRWID